MTAADKTKLDGLLASTTQGFPSRLDVAATVIDDAELALRASELRKSGYGEYLTHLLK
ncbi:MAG: hypothetical protein V3R90_04515 [Limibaculum sp.]